MNDDEDGEERVRTVAEEELTYGGLIESMNYDEG